VDGETPAPYTCYTKDILEKLRARWNARHTDTPITTNDPKEIWKQLHQNLSHACDEEKCWIQQNFVDETTRKQIKEIAFVPDAPKEWKRDPNTWLSSVDISKVMKQYEKKYKCFRFIGPSPIDFDSHYMNTSECVWEELCHFSLEKYTKARVFKIGVIFNLDKHTEAGSHWVSMFIHLRKKYIFYFNSTGEPTPPEVKRLCVRIRAAAKKAGLGNMTFYENKKEHQQKDTECGMYSLFFIISMLKDEKSVEYFKTGNIPDKMMEGFRAQYFQLPE
jgi:hypothetical protein